MCDRVEVQDIYFVNWINKMRKYFSEKAINADAETFSRIDKNECLNW